MDAYTPAPVDPPLTRPGEESGQLGEDAAFVFRFKKALRDQPLVANLIEALRALAAAHDEVDLEELEFVIEMRLPQMQATLEREGIADSFRMDFAMAIYLYTIDNPQLYKCINTASHALERDTGTGLSPTLRACMPYIKVRAPATPPRSPFSARVSLRANPLRWVYTQFLDVALESLPLKYIVIGRVNRGVKWAFPTPEDHDPETHFPKGARFHTSEDNRSAYRPLSYL